MNIFCFIFICIPIFEKKKHLWKWFETTITCSYFSSFHTIFKVFRFYFKCTIFLNDYLEKANIWYQIGSLVNKEEKHDWCYNTQNFGTVISTWHHTVLTTIVTTIGLICKRKKMLFFYTTIFSCYGGWANCLPLRAWICTTGVSLGILIYGCTFQSCDPLHPLSFNNTLELLNITWVQIEPSKNW